MTLTIYDWHNGPYPARIRIALAETGLSARARFVSVDLRKGEHKTAAFREKNYSGTLPVLELEDGTLIAECTAITEFLDALESPPCLTGRTAREKGVIHMMSKRAELEVLDAVSHYFHHATPGLGPHVETYQNPDWGTYQRDKAMRGMVYFDGVLRGRPYVAGEFFSMADITLVGGLIFAGLLELPLPEGCEALSAWYARMNERPSVRNWRGMSGPAPRSSQPRSE